MRTSNLTGNISIVDKARAFVELTKPRLTILVLFSAVTGFYLGSVETVNLLLLSHAVLGIGMASAGALALNQFLERSHDAQMERTSGRPLPQGRLTPGEACSFGLSLSLLSVAYVFVNVNLLTAVIVLLTIGSYLFAYTPMKRVSTTNTAIGAVSGALPIVCGYTAVQNQLDLAGGILFLILFLWQFPHFLSIALIYQDEYQHAGYKMMPSGRNGRVATAQHIVWATVLLIGVSTVPTLIGLTGNIYLGVAFISGLYFLYCGIRVARQQTPAMAKRLMLASFVYPLLLWSFMIIDKNWY